MTRIIAKRTINAPIDSIFAAVADIENLPATNKDIKSIEFLTEQRSGVGTRFRETRVMKGKQHITELEVTEYQPSQRLRMVTDSHGTVWDTVFTISAAGELTIDMDARAHKLLPKLLNPILKGMFRKGIEQHLDALKNHLETAN